MSKTVFEVHKSPSKPFKDLETAQEFVGEREFDMLSTNLSRIQISDEGRLVMGGKKKTREIGPVYDLLPKQLLKAAGLPAAVLHTHVSDEETRSYINEGLRQVENGRVVIQLMDGMPYQLISLLDGQDIPVLYDPRQFVEIVGNMAAKRGLNFFRGGWDGREMRFLLYSGEDRKGDWFKVGKDDPYVTGLDVRNIFQRGVQVSGAIQRNVCTNSTILAGGEFIFREGFSPEPGVVLNSLRKWGEQFTVDLTSLGKDIKKLQKIELNTGNMTSVVNGVGKAAGRSTAAKVLSPFVKTNEDGNRFETDELGVIQLTRRQGEHASMYDVFNEITERAQVMASRKRIALEEFSYKMIGGQLAGAWKVEEPSENGDGEE